MFVGNLAFDTTSERLLEIFGEVGEVVNRTVPTDRLSGRPRGFAFVEFSTAEQAASATERLNGYELGGRALRVNEANDGQTGGPSFRPGFGSGGRGFRRARRAAGATSAPASAGSGRARRAAGPANAGSHLLPAPCADLAGASASAGARGILGASV